MIEGWNGADVGAWAIAQGYPGKGWGYDKDYIQVGYPYMWVYLMDAVARPGAVPALSYYYIDTRYGSVIKDNKYPDYQGYTPQNGRRDGHLIPVRSLQGNEFYYYQ